MFKIASWLCEWQTMSFTLSWTVYVIKWSHKQIETVRADHFNVSFWIFCMNCNAGTQVNWSEKIKNRSIYCIMQTCICTKAESCLCSVCVCDVYELQRMRKDVAVVLCMCELQRARNRVVIASLFDCVWAQRVGKALLLLCRCQWDCSALLTSIACRRFVVTSYR